MKIICFVGEGKVGKSTTIGKVLKDVLKVDIVRPKIRVDFCLSFIYNGELLGICSHGDNTSILKEFLIPLKEKGCKTIICASRPSNKSMAFLKNEIGGEIKEIECREVNNRNNEEEWREEHSRRLREFERVF